MRQRAAVRGVELDLRVGIEDEALVDTLNRATVMVYCPRLEPFGFAPLEANACGLPVVAAAEGGVRETVTNGVNGLVVEPEPRALGQAIRGVIEEPMLARQLGTAGMQLVLERWTLRDSIDRLERRLLETSKSLASRSAQFGVVE